MKSESDRVSEHARHEAPGIVSVNQVGRTGQGSARAIVALATVAAVLTIGGLYGWNRYRAYSAAKEATAKAEEKREIKPAAVGQRRTFEPLAVAAGMPASAPTVPKLGATDCLPVDIKDGAGKPVLDATGRPLRIGCDGKPVGSLPTTVAGQALADGGTVPRSRFRGDVLLYASEDGPLGAKPASSTTGEAAPPAGVDPSLVYMLDRLSPAAKRAERTDGGKEPTRKLPMSYDSTSGRPNRSGFMKVADMGPALPGGGTFGATDSEGGRTQSDTRDFSLGDRQLTPSSTARVKAAQLGNRSFLLTKGTQIDCALTTRMVNEVSGFASCVLPLDVWSRDGKVKLLERGSTVTGEYGARMQTGQRRLFILWSRIETPTGVVVDIASPGADALGTQGLDGYVDNRWWDRIGAAYMLSIVKDVVAAAAAHQAGSAGGVTWSNTTKETESIAEIVLKNTINIPPTLYKNQGDRASIYLSRDLDFSSVYELARTY